MEQFKYLGVVFNAGRVLSVDLMSVMRKFYAALNSLSGKCCNCAEPVSDISNRLVYLGGFFTSLEFHYHSVTMLRFSYARNVCC